MNGNGLILTRSWTKGIIRYRNGRFIPPGSASVPEINELDLEDIDPDEGDLDAILSRATKPSKNEKGEKVPAVEEKPIQPPLAYDPYYARDYCVHDSATRPKSKMTSWRKNECSVG